MGGPGRRELPCRRIFWRRKDEEYPYFNDIDDYHGLETIVNTTKRSYKVNITVDYVIDSTPLQVVDYETFFKIMVVTVTYNVGPQQKSVRTSMVFGYY